MNKPQPKPVKARRLFVAYMPKTLSDAPMLAISQDSLTPKPVFVIPGDAMAYDKMVEQSVHVLNDAGLDAELLAAPTLGAFNLIKTRRLLAAIGITRPTS